MSINNEVRLREPMLADVYKRIDGMMKTHSLQVGKKRNRLHNILAIEFESHNAELDHLKEMKAKEYFEERKNKCLSSLLLAEEKRKQIAEHQLELYTRENNEYMKIHEAQQKCLEAAAYNREQMEERQRMKTVMNQVDSTVERFLHHYNLQQIEKEDETERKRIKNAIRDFDVLKNQIIEKRLQLEEKIISDVKDYEHIKQLAKTYEDKEKQEELKKRQDKQQLAREKHEDMTSSLLKRKEREMFERDLAKTLSKIHLIDENRPSCSKEQLRMEQDLFLEKQQSLRENMKRAETLEDELRQIEQKRQEAIEKKNRLRDEMMKRKRYQDVLQTQIVQIMATKKN